MSDPLDPHLDLIICSTCGTQFSTPSPPPNCKICDDPRQYIPPTGQTWTTLRTLHNASPTYTNIFTPLPLPQGKSNLYSIHTIPKLGISQRAFLLLTPHGNVLWDCLTYLDDETIRRISALGGLRAIVISHPHYYTSHVVWGEVFGCDVFLAAEDREDDIIAIKTGGHFPGSCVLWWRSQKVMFLADTIGTVPSGIYHVGREPGTASYTFMWSYPNMIPLPPDDVHTIWKSIRHTDFDTAYGAFVGMDTHGHCKRRVLESAKIFVRAMGYRDHAIHGEECD
ncbi:metallo-beta-lactamase family protein [Aspergillus heteromorphus CBS 117.55]|uniref:Metallo-beta-lactamase family protein n=1 Tax=Aspergillus heteromorphus CBS 117.55 TaxID=1448321 RepID=A0A317WUJ8_9EURO|nr:metallo-beta-lactamase family protein [Aspergillus heteromorphus CBS 117.55]PWY88528.1 metallo-beta-lactamase family protein [Aspergillus heteromorphus CBS 117.55]